MRIRYGGNLQSPSSRARLKRRREPHWVVIQPGCALGYRKGANGGTWVARVRRADGRHEYHALGAADDLNDGAGLDYEAATARARQFFGLAARASARKTVGDALDAYLAARVAERKPESTIADARKRIDSVIRPALGGIPLSKLRPDDIEAWKQDLAKKQESPASRDENGKRIRRVAARKPETVNRLLTILKAALNVAWKRGWVGDDSAWRKVERLSGGDARKVFLTRAQCRALLDAAKPAEFRALVQAGLLTGCRSGELAALRAHDFDAPTATLEIQGGKTGARVVYLGQEAVEFFEGQARDKAPDALLFPRPGGGAWQKNHHQKPMMAAVKAAALPMDCVFYSLRHTHISLALLAGVNIQVLAENTGTSVRMIERHYGKFLNRDRRAMFDRVTGLT